MEKRVRGILFVGLVMTAGFSAWAGVPAREDWLQVYSGEFVALQVKERIGPNSGCYVEIDSGSDWKATASGLPAGVKFNAADCSFSGAPTKEGIYYVTVKATNANKFSHSATVRWTVGNPVETDYDDIGLIWEDGTLDYCWDCGAPFDEFEFQTGRECFLYWSNFDEELKSVSGLPTGLKFVKEQCSVLGLCMGSTIRGTPTKPGKYKVTFTSQNGRKAVQTIVVKDSGSVYVDVYSVSEGGGTVSGAGVYAVGSKITLRAKAKKGYFFSGWYVWDDPLSYEMGGLSGDYRTANVSIVLSPGFAEEACVEGRFVSSAKDREIDIEFDGYGADGEWLVDTKYDWDYRRIDVRSFSLPKLTVKGLPPGIKLMGDRGEYWLETDSKKIKPGTSIVTLTAKNQSGATVSRTVKIVVPNLRSWLFEDLDYEGEYVFTVGDSRVCEIGESFFTMVESGYKVTASGLPSGLSLGYRADTGEGYWNGIPTKPGTYTVTLTAKKGSVTEKATVTVTVLPFPAYAVGTFSGTLYSDYGRLCYDEDEEYLSYEILPWETRQIDGTVTVTVSANGKTTAKFTTKGKTVSLSGYPCVEDGEVYINCFDDKGNAFFAHENRDADTSWGMSRWEGFVESASGETWNLVAQKNVFSTNAQAKWFATQLSKFGKCGSVVWAESPYSGSLVCPNCCAWDSLSEKVSFTVGANGIVKAAGKIAKQTVSGTAQLMFDQGGEFVYADFYFYKAKFGTISYRVFFYYWDVMFAAEEDYGPNDIVGGGRYAVTPWECLAD